MVHKHNYDITQPIKILDVYTIANLIDKLENHNGEIKVMFEGYRQHPFHEINVSEVLNVLLQEKQIQLSNELPKSEYIHGGNSRGSHREFVNMLMECINKTFLILPNFNMPPTDSSYLIPKSLMDSLPKQLLATILEINDAYLNGLHIACGILLRRLLEGAILLKYTQLEKLDDLKNADGDYIGLGKMVNIICDNKDISLHSTLRKNILQIKWIGDKGAHNFDLIFFREDIKSNLTYIKDFLMGLKF